MTDNPILRLWFGFWFATFQWLFLTFAGGWAVPGIILGIVGILLAILDVVYLMILAIFESAGLKDPTPFCDRLQEPAVTCPELWTPFPWGIDLANFALRPSLTFYIIAVIIIGSFAAYGIFFKRRPDFEGDENPRSAVQLIYECAYEHSSIGQGIFLWVLIWPFSLIALPYRFFTREVVETAPSEINEPVEPESTVAEPIQIDKPIKEKKGITFFVKWFFYLWMAAYIFTSVTKYI